MKPVTEMGAIVVAALMSAVVVNAISPNGIAWVGQWDTAVGVISARTNDGSTGAIREIHDPDMAKTLFDSGEVLFVDARSEDAYAAGRVAGAISLPVSLFDVRLGAFIGQYDMGLTIVTYCSGRTCEDSHHLAKSLMELGYEDVRVMIDGYPAWRSKGFPVEP